MKTMSNTANMLFILYVFEITNTKETENESKNNFWRKNELYKKSTIKLLKHNVIVNATQSELLPRSIDVSAPNSLLKLAVKSQKHNVIDNATQPELIPRSTDVNSSFLRLRVIKGVPDVDNKYSFVVSLQDWSGAVLHRPTLGYYRICSGSLILENWVLTAGHCVQLGASIVRYGNVSAPGYTIENYSIILKQIPHPNYEMIRFNKDPIVINDIALLLVQKIPLAPGRLLIVDPKAILGTAVEYAGYGATSDLMQHAKEYHELLNKDYDKPRMLGQAVVTECDWELFGRHCCYTMICIAHKCGKRTQAPHIGDSGGPLFTNGRIIGVFSQGFPTGDKGIYMSAYTAVASHIDWITRTIATTRLDYRAPGRAEGKSGKASAALESSG